MRTGLDHHFPDIRERYREIRRYPALNGPVKATLYSKFRDLHAISLREISGNFFARTGKQDRDIRELRVSEQAAKASLLADNHPGGEREVKSMLTLAAVVAAFAILGSFSPCAKAQGAQKGETIFIEASGRLYHAEAAASAIGGQDLGLPAINRLSKSRDLCARSL